MSDADQPSSLEAALAALRNHGIVAGFGIPGRSAANLLMSRGVALCVIEKNPATVQRCTTAGLLIMHGDATEERSLRQAGIERAVVLALAMPDEQAVLKSTILARRLNPTIRILARCRHVSTAMEATRHGADDVLSEEQVVAEEFSRRIDAMLR